MPESVILDVMRMVQLAVNHNLVQRLTVTVASQVAYQILNTRRAALAEIERETGKNIVVRGEVTFTSDQVDYLCEDGRGQPVHVLPAPPVTRPGRRP
jgi:Ribonuclease G/E